MIKDLEYFLKKTFVSEKYLLKKRLNRAINKNYEKELSIIDKFSNQSKSAVDAGVYRGVYSYKLAQKFKHVYAYEPNSLIYPFLEKNLTKIVKNLTLSNYALSNSNGVVNLNIPNRSKSIFKNNVEELYKLGCASIHDENLFEDYKSIEVNKTTLDETLKDINIGFIKIDVEGHEREVVEGAKKLIKICKPVLLVEIEKRHNKKPVMDTINFINQLGYSAFYCKNNELNSIEKLKNFDKEINFYFIPLNLKN